MSKLEWDKIGEHFYENGVSHGVLYPMKDDGSGYDEGVVWNGLTSVEESPDGADANDLWADDIKYGSIRSVETFGFSIEAYTYPDEFAECDGSAVFMDGVYVGQQKRKTFGFCFRTNVGSDTETTSDSDEGYKLHLIWGATASPSSRSYETVNDSPDAITFSWECETTPVVVNTTHNGKKLKPISTITIDSNKCDKEKLAKLEAKLYGTDSPDGKPELPSPDAVLTLLNSGT